jgi:hypothetical protein
MKLRGLTTALACAALFATIHSAAATSLVDEGSTTYDPNAGLRWLDLNLTQGLSYNQVLASSYVTAQGFRFATETELKSLYKSDFGPRRLWPFGRCAFSSAPGWSARQHLRQVVPNLLVAGVGRFDLWLLPGSQLFPLSSSAPIHRIRDRCGQLYLVYLVKGT